MRITEIEIKNFRAFYGSYQINLHKSGKNLLIYGENGSGKSSLYLALKLFLESGVSNHQFEDHRNIFIADDEGYIKLHLRDDPQSRQYAYEWSKTIRETNDSLIIEASKTKGFLDYKALLETHYLHREEGAVNVFDLLVNNLMANTINDTTTRSFTDDWNDLQQAPHPRRNAKRQMDALEEQLRNFNIGLSNKLEELKEKASEILDKFEYSVALDFDFQGITYNRNNRTLDNQQILLTIKFFDRNLPSHHHFLNEAKLSAIAVAMYFSSLLIQPDSALKVLALDDVLIGLDMSNRLPVMDILDEYFSNSQIFFMTYDRAWYEIVRQRTADSEWKYAEFYFSKTDKHEIPIYMEDQAYIEKAKEYFEANDYKACAIYLRAAFERAIKKFCEKMNLPVKYREDQKNLTSEDFWMPIKNERKDGTPFLEETIISDIELYRSIILNPLSHSGIANVAKNEISKAIKAVESLDTELRNKGRLCD